MTNTNDTKLELADDHAPECHFCEKTGKEKRQFREAGDEEDTKSGGIPVWDWLCEDHIQQLEDKSGIFEQ